MAWLWEGNSGSKMQETGRTTPRPRPELSFPLLSAQTPCSPGQSHSAARAVPGPQTLGAHLSNPLPSLSLAYGAQISGSQLHAPCPSPQRCPAHFSDKELRLAGAGELNAKQLPAWNTQSTRSGRSAVPSPHSLRASGPCIPRAIPFLRLSTLRKRLGQGERPLTRDLRRFHREVRQAPKD